MKPPCTVKPPELRFALLGPLQISRGPDEVHIGAHKQRLLLATLLCRVNTVMSADQLIEAIWEEAPPRTARKNLQAYVSALRRIVGQRLVHTAYGYSMRCGSAELDIIRLEETAARGRDAARGGAVADAAAAFADALALWRGPLLADVPHTMFLAAMAARFADRRLHLCEDWAEVALQLGDYRQVLDAIDDLADAHPERERLTAAKLIALCQCGRRQESLSYYEFVRVTLARDLGLDPSPQLQRLFQAMLSGDPVGYGAEHAPTRRGPRSDGAIRPVPPVRAPDERVPGGNPLPRDTADFTGRRHEIGILAESLASGADGSAVALVTGPVGTGKTALAVHVAHLLSSRFPDGQLFVPMRDQHRRQRSPADMLARLAAALGADIGDAAAPDATPAWRAWLSRRSLLVVLDDAREESAVRAIMPGQGPSRILVTSRYRLSGIESATRVELGEFSRAEAAELAAKIAGFGAVLGGLDEITSYIDRCGRLPLAIRILAGRLHERAVPPLRSGDVVDQLVLGDLSLARRYREHFDELPAGDRRLLGALVSRTKPQAASAIMADVLMDPETDTTRAIESLVEANLLLRSGDEVTAHSERYSMPALAYACARGMLLDLKQGVHGT